MSIYLPTLLLVVTIQIVLGYLLIKHRLNFLAWPGLLFLLITAILFFNANPVEKMLALVVTTLNAMKTIVTATSYKGKTFNLMFFQWVVFSTGWVGMRTEAFKSLGGRSQPGGAKLLLTGLSRVLTGLIFLAAAHLVVEFSVASPVVFVVTSVLILIGLSLILHFGTLPVFAGLWRLFGANTYLLFRKPLHSTSLAEFWGRRWNLAFIEMLSIAVLKPLKGSYGKSAAVMVSFLLSGLLHELAISVPVDAGFGGPTGYFIIQGVALLAEEKLNSKNFFLGKRVWIRRGWTFFWILFPAPLLFHEAFIKQIIWPLAGLSAAY